MMLLVLILLVAAKLGVEDKIYQVEIQFDFLDSFLTDLIKTHLLW
jgi:hypothetical protein